MDFTRDLRLDLESDGNRRRVATDRVFSYVLEHDPISAASIALQLLNGASQVPEPSPGPQWETMQQAATRSGFSYETVRRAIARGDPRVYTPTGRRKGNRIKISDLEELMSTYG